MPVRDGERKICTIDFEKLVPILSEAPRILDIASLQNVNLPLRCVPPLL
jgi:hypothetical protein